MTKRNIDQIKELKYELGRYQKKVSDQQRQIAELKAALDEAGKGMLEINCAIDSIMAETAIKFGSEAGVGAWELVLPLVSVLRNTRDYIVTAYVGDDNDSYVVRVERREAEEGGDGNV